jgi:hypothetical protein
MVLGITTGGAVLYAFTPSDVLQKATLESSEATDFLSGLKYAYMVGGTLTGIAAVTSLVRSRREGKNGARGILLRLETADNTAYTL